MYIYLKGENKNLEHEQNVFIFLCSAGGESAAKGKKIQVSAICFFLKQKCIFP